MNSEFIDPFQFSPELDNKFLNELFDGDLIYAETVFGDFLDNIPAFWTEVENAYNQQNIALLKSSVHKCKTLFGYVGHMKILQLLTEFENGCETTGALADEFEELVREKEIAVKVVEREHERLKQI